jgi:beta-ureidopropionase / N-carbamoyl-L-amino-acid hydrolase
MNTPNSQSAANKAAGASADFGSRIMMLADHLAQWSETSQGLTCTYFSPAHRAVAAAIAALMRDTGMETHIDSVGNVVGRYASNDPAAKTIIIGSHYDTVINAGKYDGRLGILVALTVVDYFARAGKHLPFNLEVIAFSEEEGVRFSASYIGSSAVVGRLDSRILQLRDAKGISLADVLRQAGSDSDTVSTLARRSSDIAGYLEVHIEQGPILLDSNSPVGVVTAIAGNSRYTVTIAGEPGHAGTVPMSFRHDAAAAGAEIVQFVERRCNRSGLVGTVGLLAVPEGAINVIPGRCELSMDIRSGQDAIRQSAVADILAEIDAIAQRRGVKITYTELLNARAVACSPRLQDALASAIYRMDLPVQRLPSGAGHDAVMFDGMTEIAMLFVRCGNGGVSHNPREIIAAQDADIATRVLLDVLQNFPLPS